MPLHSLHKIRKDLVNYIYEAVVVDIFKPNSQIFSIVAVYRPPGTEDENFCFLEGVVETLDFENKEIIAIGDLNYNYQSENRNSELSQLIAISEAYQLTQIIKEPTRITASSESLIDLILLIKNQES